MTAIQVRALLAAASFFGSVAMVNGFFSHLDAGAKVGGEFMIVWLLCLLFIGYVFYHWIFMIRRLMKRIDDKYRTPKLFFLLLGVVIASWVLPFVDTYDARHEG